MTTDTYTRQVDAIRAQFEQISVFPALVRILAEGEPVTIERLAAEGGSSMDDVRAELARHPGVEWERGRVVGLGMTLRPTPHRFTFDGRTVFGRCATDALIFPALLDRPGVVESTCPLTGHQMRAEVTPNAVIDVEPPGAVVSEVRPTTRVVDLRAEICGLGHFFASRETAAGWLTQHPEGQVNSVAEDFAIHRDVMAQLGWIPTKRAMSGPRVQILHVEGCPLVDGLRETVRRSLARAGCAARIEELEADYPSPTLLIDDIDVVTGRPPDLHPACRLDVPTEDQVVAALRAAQARHAATTTSATDVG